MNSDSEYSISGLNPQESKVNFLDLILVLSRHIRIVLAVTIVIFLCLFYSAKSKPKEYTSSAKLMILEFVDQTKVLRVGNDGRLVLGKKQGYWKPSDVSIMKNIIESDNLKQSVANRLPDVKEVKYTLSTLKDDQVGIVTINVWSEEQSLADKIVTVSIEEAGRQAFRLGFLASPLPIVDNMSRESDGGGVIFQLLEPPKQGKEIKSNIMKSVLLPTLMGFCFSMLLVLIIDYFQNLSTEDRDRISMIKVALRGKKNMSPPLSPCSKD